MTIVAARQIAILPIFLAAACGGGFPQPASLDTRTEHCRFCRMAISDTRTAGQIIAPGEEPVFFDDIGCLAGFAGQGPETRPDVVVYVIDHRTREWVIASQAVFTRVEHLETPMGSRLVAHSTSQSREADPDAKGGVAVSFAEIFGASVENGGG